MPSIRAGAGRGFGGWAYTWSIAERGANGVEMGEPATAVRKKTLGVSLAAAPSQCLDQRGSKGGRHQ